MARRKADHERKHEKKKRLLSIIIGVIMVASTFGIMFSGYGTQKETLEFRGYVFEQDGNYLVTKVNKTEIMIQTNPYELETLEFNDSIREAIRDSQMVYISFPLKGLYPEYASLAAYDLSEFFGTKDIYAMGGISDDNSDYPQIPLVDCRNATAEIPVIMFVQANETSSRIAQEGDCITVEAAAPYQFITLKDRIVMGLAGVI